MTANKNTRPGADAVRHLEEAKLIDTVEIFEKQATQMPEGSDARRIINDLAAAGREELEERSRRASGGANT